MRCAAVFESRVAVLPGNGAVLNTALPSIIIVATPPLASAWRIDSLTLSSNSSPLDSANPSAAVTKSGKGYV